MTAWARLVAPARRSGLAGQVLALQVLVVGVTVAVCAVAAVVVAQRLTNDAATQRVLAVARTVAAAPEVAAALDDAEPSRVLQPLAERVRETSGVSFVVVMAPDRTRFSHPNPANIGHSFIGTVEPALAGGEVTESFVGTLGPSVRAVVPVRAGGRADGPVVGMVAVGLTEDRVADALAPAVPVLASGIAVALAVAAFGSWLVARRVRRQTFGMGATEIARVYEHHDAVLHAMREGLLVIDTKRRLVLVNDEAQHLLGLGDDAVGRPVSDLPIDGALARLLAEGTEVEDEVHLAGERLVVVSQAPASAQGRPLGTVVTMRDRTELAALTDELGSVRSIADALHAQAHEAANRLHTVVTLIELGDEQAALAFASSVVERAQGLTDRLFASVEEPALVALLLGKTAEGQERSVELVVTDDTCLRRTPFASDDLVTITGNLVDNAFDAVQQRPSPRRVQVRIVEEPIEDAGAVVVEVRDNGPGLSEEAMRRMFEPGWSTKPSAGRGHGRGIGLALVQQVVQRLDGRIAVVNDEGAVVTVHLPVRQTDPVVAS